MSRALLRSSAFSTVLALAALAASLVVVVAAPAGAYPTGEVTFEGRGYGHGRGLGQYGAFGYAVDEARPYSWIVDHFYGGTTRGNRQDGVISVKLTALDGTTAAPRDLLVTSGHPYAIGSNAYAANEAARIRWAGDGWVIERGPACTGPWTVAEEVGPTARPEAKTSYAGDDVEQMLTICGQNSRTYRGSLMAAVLDKTFTRVLNWVPMEQYLRGVVPRESPPSWGDAGGGKGMDALKAQAVAARSYAWAETRHAEFKTCDTTACQVYSGAGLNGDRIEHQNSDAAISATAGEVRMLASGAVARTEFSSSTGGHTAPGTFNPVPDTGDDTTTNPNRRWSVKIPVADVEAAYPSIGALRSITVVARNGFGGDGGRATKVRVSGSKGVLEMTGNDLRSRFFWDRTIRPNGLKSDWFTAIDVVVDVARLQGADRTATAVAVSTDQFAAGAAQAAVLVSSANYPDALVGVPLAMARNAPILLSAADRVADATMAELQRATGGGKTVYLLGGTAALGTSVEGQLKAAGYSVVRYGGTSRYATAVLVAEALGNPATVLEATGTGFADALAAGAAAAKATGAVLLTNGNQQAPETAAYLNGRNVTRFAVGGAAAAADPAATALVGADRYATAVAVADRFFPGPTVAGLASGTNYPDALSGGVHAARKGGPLVLTATASLPTPTKQYLQGNADLTLTKVFVYGGPSAVSDQVIAQLKTR